MSNNSVVFNDRELAVVNRLRGEVFKAVDIFAQLRGLPPGVVLGLTEDGRGFLTSMGGGDGGESKPAVGDGTKD